MSMDFSCTASSKSLIYTAKPALYCFYLLLLSPHKNQSQVPVHIYAQINNSLKLKPTMKEDFLIKR